MAGSLSKDSVILMPQSRRTTVELFLELLDNCETPVHPTRLMHLCNVAYYHLMKYCDYLISKGLIEKVEGVKLSRDPRARTDKRTRYQFLSTMKGKRVLALTRSSEVGLLFGYSKWVQDEVVS